MTAAPEISITWPAALAWRMERHFLAARDATSVAATVDRLGAVPAMDETLAELAVRTRCSDSAPGALGRALAGGEVIKAYAFRGAVHYLSPERAGRALALRAAGRQWERASWVEYYGLEPGAWPGFRATVREALQDGPLTVGELGEQICRRPAYRHLKPVFDDGAGTLIKPLTWLGDMSIGPHRDRQQTFQRLDTNPRWAGIPDLDEAGPQAITHYFRVYGPARLDRLHYWLGDGLSAGRRRLTGWIRDLGDRLVPVDVDGTTAYAHADDIDALAAAVPTDAVRVLPGHDQWVMGPGTADADVTPPATRTAMTRKANPLIHGGIVCGVWALRGRTVTVTWLTEPLPTPAVEPEVRRLAQLLGRDLDLRVQADSAPPA